MARRPTLCQLPAVVQQALLQPLQQRLFSAGMGVCTQVARVLSMAAGMLQEFATARQAGATVAERR